MKWKTAQYLQIFMVETTAVPSSKKYSYTTGNLECLIHMFDDSFMVHIAITAAIAGTVEFITGRYHLNIKHSHIRDIHLPFIQDYTYRILRFRVLLLFHSLWVLAKKPPWWFLILLCEDSAYFHNSAAFQEKEVTRIRFIHYNIHSGSCYRSAPLPFD